PARARIGLANSGQREASCSMFEGCRSPSESETGTYQGNQPMHKLYQSLAFFVDNEDGPTAVEYAVMLALIIVVCIAAISTLGSTTSNTFTYVGTKVATTSS